MGLDYISYELLASFLGILVISAVALSVSKLRGLERRSWWQLLKWAFSVAFWVTALLTAVFGGSWYWDRVSGDGKAAAAYVRGHYAPSNAFSALSPDLQSVIWNSESKDLDCLSVDYHCTDVSCSFNVMSGAEVKRLRCVWRVRFSWDSDKIVSAEPSNTEARQLFLPAQASEITR